MCKTSELPASTEGMLNVTIADILKAMKANDANLWNFVGDLPDGRLVSIALGVGRDGEVLAAGVQAHMSTSRHVPLSRKKR
jgi:hypothetical protein